MNIATFQESTLNKLSTIGLMVVAALTAVAQVALLLQ
jgi:hypothetical protein